MYLGIDVGGTKTFVAALTNDGTISQQRRFETPKLYPDFIQELGKNIAALDVQDFLAAGVAMPGKIDRAHGRVLHFGNLKWENVPVVHDIERLSHCPVVVENDANLAGLSEAMLLKEHQKVLYITVSTGIGTGFIANQQIDPSMADSEGGDIMLQRGDKIVKWESFASGKAIVKRYGKRASEITDEATWRAIGKDLAVGFLDLIAVTQPDVIVVGGGVGHYLDRFHDYLVAELKKYENPMMPIPRIQKAKRPDEAVVYGCYDLVKVLYPAHGRPTH